MKTRANFGRVPLVLLGVVLCFADFVSTDKEVHLFSASELGQIPIPDVYVSAVTRATRSPVS